MKMNFWKVYALVATGALAFVIGNSIHTADAGAQPHLVSAMEKLRGAVEQLEKAKGEFAGHRAKAIAAARLAMDETKLAMASEDRPPAPVPQAPAPKK